MCSIYLCIFIHISQFNSLSLGIPPSDYLRALQHNNCNIFNHKSPLSLFLASFISFPPPLLPSISDCFSYHLYPRLSTAYHYQKDLSLHTTPLLLFLFSAASLIQSPTSTQRSLLLALPLSLPPIFSPHPSLSRFAPLSLSPSNPRKKTHALAAAVEVALLQTRKIHLEQPSAAFLAPSEIS